MQRTLFSSRPPSSVTRPPYGYSRGTEGLSMTKAYWTAKPNPTNPRKASVNWRSATFGGTTGASGPHIEMTSSVSCSCCKEFQSFGEERKKNHTTPVKQEEERYAQVLQSSCASGGLPILSQADAASGRRERQGNLRAACRCSLRRRVRAWRRCAMALCA